jgi:ferredoxin
VRVVVDLNRCQGYAQCCYAAADHFTIAGHEILTYDPNPPDTRRAEIRRAALACPVQAILVEFDDPNPEAGA